MFAALVFDAFAAGFFLQPATGFGERSFDEASWKSVLTLSQYPQERGVGYSRGMWGWLNGIPWRCFPGTSRLFSYSRKRFEFFWGGMYFLIWCYLCLSETMGPIFGAGLCEDLCTFSCGAWCISLQLTIRSVEGSSLGCGIATLLARIQLHFTGIQWINHDKPKLTSSKAYQKMLEKVWTRVFL